MFLLGIFLLVWESVQSPMEQMNIRTRTIRPFLEPWSELGGTCGILVFLATGILGSRAPFKSTFAEFAQSVLLAGVAAQLLKCLFGRARPGFRSGTSVFYGPFGWFSDHELIRPDSLPSGHTAAAFAMAACLSWRWPKLSLLWYSLAVCVGTSRVVAYVHFPSDVVFGALIGLISSSIIRNFLGNGPLVADNV